MRVGFWICIVIAVAAVLRRLYALAHPAVGLDDVFATHERLTLAHILPALLFVLLAPMVIYRKTERFPWTEAAIYPIGFVVGVTAYAMVSYAVGGWVEISAVLFFNSLFLFSLFKSLMYRHIDAWLQRRWMIRAIVILLGIATTRPVMAVFFATSRFTHWTLNQFFGVAFWIGFSINAVIGEIWLRRSAQKHFAER